jgi:hypothetical protein
VDLCHRIHLSRVSRFQSETDDLRARSLASLTATDDYLGRVRKFLAWSEDYLERKSTPRVTSAFPPVPLTSNPVREACRTILSPGKQPEEVERLANQYTGSDVGAKLAKELIGPSNTVHPSGKHRKELIDEDDNAPHRASGEPDIPEADHRDFHERWKKKEREFLREGSGEDPQGLDNEREGMDSGITRSGTSPKGKEKGKTRQWERSQEYYDMWRGKDAGGEWYGDRYTGWNWAGEKGENHVAHRKGKGVIREVAHGMESVRMEHHSIRPDTQGSGGPSGSSTDSPERKTTPASTAVRLALRPTWWKETVEEEKEKSERMRMIMEKKQKDRDSWMIERKKIAVEMYEKHEREMEMEEASFPDRADGQNEEPPVPTPSHPSEGLAEDRSISRTGRYLFAVFGSSVSNESRTSKASNTFS